MKLFDLLFRKTRAPVGRPVPPVARTGKGPAARALASAQNESLSAPAHRWVRELPAVVRPLELCNAYPRIANRLAECWDDPALVEAALDDLLVDHRGGRRGFPAQISAELLRLQAFHENKAGRQRGRDR